MVSLATVTQQLLLPLSPPAGLPEDNSVETPAFTDAVRLYRQDQGHYGTWDMMCGTPPQVRAAIKRQREHHLM